MRMKLISLEEQPNTPCSDVSIPMDGGLLEFFHGRMWTNSSVASTISLMKTIGGLADVCNKRIMMLSKMFLDQNLSERLSFERFFLH